MSTDSPSTTDHVPFAHEGCRVVGCACGNLAREKAAEAAFKEPAEDLNTTPDVQGNVNDSTTDRLAERYSLDEIRAYLSGPPVVTDERHRGDVDRMAWLLALHDSVRDQLHRVAEEAQRLQERLDTAEGRLDGWLLAPHHDTGGEYGLYHGCNVDEAAIGIGERSLRSVLDDVRDHECEEESATVAPDSEMDPFEAADEMYRRWE